jgi:glycosyltransferase involved in cell wall biosynthesis
MTDLDLTTCFIAGNVKKYGYPYEPAILQALKLSRVIINVDLDSEDDTVAIIKKFPVTVIENHWGQSKNAGRVWLRQQKQKVIDAATTGFILYLDIDELLHEDAFSWIQHILTRNLYGFNGITFRYYHFYGDMKHVQPDNAGAGWSTKITRLARRPTKFIDGSDGFGLAVPSLEVGMSPHRIFHYSHVRQREIWHEKNEMMYARYGKTYNRLSIDYGALDAFNGHHPEIVGKYAGLFEQGG